MRRHSTLIQLPLILTLGVVLLLLSILMCAPGGAGAEDPRPTAAARSNTITVIHTHDGIPTPGILPHATLQIAYADGVFCSTGAATIVTTHLATPVRWPWGSGGACAELGAMVKICLNENVCTPEFVYDGEDETVFLERPDMQLPPPSGHVTARFLQGDASISVTPSAVSFRGPVNSCNGHDWDGARVQVTALTHWYLAGFCSNPGEMVESTIRTLDYGELHASFIWNGGDLTYDVQVPGGEALTPSPSASPTPGDNATTAESDHEAPAEVVSPAALPRSGAGSGKQGPNNFRTAVILAVAASTALMATVAGRKLR